MLLSPNCTELNQIGPMGSIQFDFKLEVKSVQFDLKIQIVVRFDLALTEVSWADGTDGVNG